MSNNLTFYYLIIPVIYHLQRFLVTYDEEGKHTGGNGGIHNAQTNKNIKERKPNKQKKRMLMRMMADGDKPNLCASREEEEKHENDDEGGVKILTFS